MRLYLPTTERIGVVDSLIQKLGLESVANKSLNRISLDQSKKVTIAVELVSSPGKKIDNPKQKNTELKTKKKNKN